MNIPFNRPLRVGSELEHLAAALEAGRYAGDGPATQRCQAWLERTHEVTNALLTPSCTAALELAALLLDIGPGDEVILPSYTFVSTANAFVLRGATPVFVDVRPDTCNIDETRIAAAITSRTRAIVVVHYGGVGCEMDVILDLARAHGIAVVEDAAQALLARWRGRPLGAFGDCSTLSFHETKNIHCGEGGALLLPTEALAERAEILREKGTNRRRFLRGQVDKYTWVDVGSSFLVGELAAAMLEAQFEAAEHHTQARRALWAGYHAAFAAAEQRGLLRRPRIPTHCDHNAHLYPVLLPSLEARSAFIAHCAAAGVQCVFHYIPLHTSPMGARVGRAAGSMDVTDALGECLVRLPLWCGLETHQAQVIDVAHDALAAIGTTRWQHPAIAP